MGEAKNGFESIQKTMKRGFVVLCTMEILGFAVLFVLFAMRH
jgi:hypothetical protein